MERKEIPRNLSLGKLILLGHHSTEPICLGCKHRSLQLFPEVKQTVIERMQSIWQGEKLTSPAVERLLYSSFLQRDVKPVSRLSKVFLDKMSQTSVGASIVKKTIRDMEPSRLYQLGMYEAMASTLRQRELRLKRRFKLARKLHQQ